jgi:hypothetical protein
MAAFTGDVLGSWCCSARVKNVGNDKNTGGL